MERGEIDSRKAKPNVRVWGLTGGIASGKSTAARLFADEGFQVLDADAISRKLSLPGGAAFNEILNRFGTADRDELRQIVFADPSARRDLEAVLHPKIREESARQIQESAKNHQGDAPCYILYEATLLAETGRYRDFDGLIVVSAPLEMRRERLLARDSIKGISPETAERILASQLPDSEREAVATYVIHNHGAIEDLKNCVHQIALKIRSF